MFKKYMIFGTGADVANNGAGYYPSDIRARYNIPDDLDGSGQSIGLLEFSSGYSLTDAQQFWQAHDIAAPQVQFVSVDGTHNDHGSAQADEEASLDLQWAGALAPGASLRVYEATPGNSYAGFANAMEQTLQYILNEADPPSVLSISYGDAESTFGADAVRRWSDLIGQLDARGVTVCIASGDQGAYGKHEPPQGTPERNVDAPASIPSAVSVGGTSLKLNGGETAWTYVSAENGGATGGGYSSVFSRPQYQNAVVASGQGRGVPDVALNADPATGYQIIFGGQSAVVGGTSVACPVFAAIVVLANQLRVKNTRPVLSGLTATLYADTTSLNFHDITSGNNSYAGVEGYTAKTGWDACTGWGSLHATDFIQALAEI
ncbi:MAG: S53 family peptidase [Gammaproteobacteria bacterium]